jgi:hypothetical protein
MEDQNWEKVKKEIDKDEAKRTLLEIEAAKILATNNDFGCEIHIGTIIIGVCDNSEIVPLLDLQQKEIEKFLNGEPNKWE